MSRTDARCILIERVFEMYEDETELENESVID